MSSVSHLKALSIPDEFPVSASIREDLIQNIEQTGGETLSAVGLVAPLMLAVMRLESRLVEAEDRIRLLEGNGESAVDGGADRSGKVW
ncbi:hypothetical protein R1X32_42610 [Rhodococcus opacus]|uniref:hypothetical protein n=1 Tax=Rhodococcus opacus TaxID=37919 RepID=UPI0034D2CDA8